MIGSKVVNLLLEQTGPKVFTDELHDVQLVFEPCSVFGQSSKRKNCSNESQKLDKTVYLNQSIIENKSGVILYFIIVNKPMKRSKPATKG